MTAITAPAHHAVTITSPDSPFITERGDVLSHVEIAYETWGTLNPQRDNVVLVTHALTGDSHVAATPADPRPGWWEPLIGPGRPIDTDRFFVICSNLLGSCYGSTGPSSIDPSTGRPYNLRFPYITIRDIVAAQERLLTKLGIHRLHTIIGGSLGGMQALEWAAMFPDRVGRIVPIATSGRFSAQGIAYNEVQRRAIMLDPAWNGGDYEPGAGPEQGLAIARMVGMITYQCDGLMEARFGRRPEARYTAWPEFFDRYDIEGYLHYQGDKLVRRFDANSYLYLTRAMDSHDLGRGRDSYLAGLSRIQARTLSIGVSSDILFPPYQAEEIATQLRRLGRDAHYHELESENGHDAFLKDFDLLAPVIQAFVEED